MAEEVNTEELAATPTDGSENAPITAGDLATMVRIIDAGSQRGTFKGEEMEVVGALRNKLATIVNALAPATEETNEETNEEEATEKDEEVTASKVSEETPVVSDDESVA